MSRAKQAAVVVAAGAALALVVLGGGISAAAGRTDVPPLYDVSYGYLTRSTGAWTYPDDGGLTPDLVIQAIEGSGTQFVKVARESPPDAQIAPYLDQLHAQSPPLQLGVRLNVRPKPQGTSRTVAALLKRARHLRHAPSGCTPAPSATPCYFDWIFLDGGMLRKTKSLQKLVDGLRAKGRTGGGGWQMVMSNDTGWPKQGTKLARGEWAHAHSLGLLHQPWSRSEKRHVVHVVKHHPHKVITRSDRRFIREVHSRDPGSHAVLKFEVHTETDKLQKLSRRVQVRLLRELSAAQSRFHFRLIYPLFVSAGTGERVQHCGGRTACRAYNSLADSPDFSRAVRGQGTYDAQRKLMLGDP